MKVMAGLATMKRRGRTAKPALIIGLIATAFLFFYFPFVEGRERRAKA